jgi:hypothetical protein
MLLPNVEHRIPLGQVTSESEQRDLRYFAEVRLATGSGELLSPSGIWAETRTKKLGQHISADGC